MKTEDSTFTPLTPEEIRDIPLGYTRDSFGNYLTSKDSKGCWWKYTRDSFGNPLTYENSNGYWYKCTLDSFGNYLTSKDSKGCWWKYTRDSFGNPLTYENSNGISKVFLGESDDYDLWYNLKTSKYVAGCFTGTYREAMKRWNIPGRTDDRALLFTELIKMHHESLGKI
jgi:hypothetical protein